MIDTTGRTWEGKHHLLDALAALCDAQSIDDAALKGNKGKQLLFSFFLVSISIRHGPNPNHDL